MGGGGGSTAREALRHNGLEKVVMCDIDEASLAAWGSQNYLRDIIIAV